MAENDEEFSVVVIGASKVFVQNRGIKRIVLANVNITIPKGLIYALLGPSGCGKTTLFKCLLGLQNLDNGTILICGHPPNSKSSGIPGRNVGYMPQELVVYHQLTISESIRYMGGILGLTDESILSKTNFLVDLLRLPSKTMVIRNLSGGQLRCLSFALAILHEPDLLVLDEPTVGLDPIVRHEIWTYLTNLCRKGATTIILATHYIEEARAAHKVGMMRDGMLVLDGFTDSIISNHGCTTLEDTFLKICMASPKKMEKELEFLADPVVDCNLKECKRSVFDCKPHQRSQLTVKCRTLKAIIVKNFLIILRFRGALFCTVFFPSIQMLIISFALGHSIQGIDLKVINEDIGNFGDMYLSRLKPEVVAIPATSWSDGLQAFENGISHGILHIKANFSASLVERGLNSPLVGEHILNKSKIHLLLDNTNYFVSSVIKLKAMESYHDALRTAINSTITPPISFSEPDAIHELRKPTIFWLMSGTIVITSYFSSAAIALIILTSEIAFGHSERNYIAGVSSAEMILGLMILQIIIIMAQNTGFLLTSLPILLEINRGSYLLIYCLAFCQSLGGFSYGMFLSVICSNILGLFIPVSSSLIFGILMSGTLWPLEAMPHFLRYMALMLPFAVPRQALDFIIDKGWDLSYFKILLAFGVILLWTLLFIGLTVWRYTKRLKQN